MTQNSWRQLLTAEALRLLDDLDATLPNPLTSDALVSTVSSLRKQGTDPSLAAVVLSQLKLRRKAIHKFGEFAQRMLFTEAGLEQATRLNVAAQHVMRYRTLEAQHIADLGCGIGGDAMALAAFELKVTAVERDEVTASIASYNLAPFPTATVVHSQAEEFSLEGVDALWFDPARRAVTASGQRRLANPADWSPSLDWVFDLARKKPSGIKISPAIADELIPREFEAQWISDRGDVVECVLWSGALARENIRRSALLLTAEGTHELTAAGRSADEPVAELGDYLYEPDGAVIRAGLIGDLARKLNAHPIDSTIAYLSSNEYHPTPFASGFRIIAQLSAKVDKLRRELASREIGTLEIKKRGADIDPAILRKQLKLSGKKSSQKHPATLVMTRVAGRHTALLVERLPSD